MDMIKTDLTMSKKKFPYIFLLLISWLILIVPLIDTRIIPGHDYIFHVTRILDVAEAIKTGIFPVRIYVDEVQFWGTPVGIFYPSLFSYFPILLKLAGIPVEVCYNAFIALIFLLGVFSSWYGFSLLTRSKSVGFYSTVLYISSGYYLMDAYIRNALGELLALSFMPLALACIDRLISRKRIPIRLYIIGILSITAVIQSHVLSSVFLVLFGLFKLLLQYKRFSFQKLSRLAVLSLVLFLLNAHFIVPFLLFYKLVPVSIDFVDTFAQAGWPVSVTFRFLLCWNFWLFFALYIFLSNMMHKLFSVLKEESKKYFFRNKADNTRSKINMQYFLAGLLFLFMSTNAFPWDSLTVLKRFFEIMQFPMRFLGLATLFFCICGGFGIQTIINRIKLANEIVVLSVCAFCIMSLITLNNLSPVSSLPHWKVPTKIYWERLISTTDDDYLYKDMDVEKLLKQGNHYISNAIISSYQKKITNVSFTYRADNDSNIVLPLVNYPGYIATDHSGKEIKIQEDSNHMMIIPLPKGAGNIRVMYKGLPLFKIADSFSLISAVIFFSVIISIHKRKLWNHLMN